MSDSIADILERTAAETPPEGEETRPAPAAEPADDAEQAAEDLRRQLAAQTSRAHQAEQARAAAEARANSAAREVTETRQTALDANFTTILTALDARNRETEALAAEMADAGEKGDYRKLAELSAKIGRAGAAIEQLESAKQQMEAERQNRLRKPAEAEAKTAPVERTADTTVGVPRETFLANVAAPVAAWLREHDQFFTDPAFYRKCISADGVVQADGISPAHPDYLSRVERIIGLDREQQPARRQQPQGAPPAAAPPARQAPSMSGKQAVATGDIYVSPEARRVATWMGVDPVGYVQDDERLRRTGEIPHRRR